MKKIIAITASFLLSLALLFVLLSPAASAENQARSQDRTLDIETQDGDDVTAAQNQDDEDEEDDESESQIRNSVRNLERVVTRFRDPEDGNQVREMVEEQNQVQERVQVALSAMEGRPGYLRFIMGPDYKNAGEVRSQIVRLDAQIEQLTRLKEKLSLQQDQDSVQTAIDSLQTEADALESELEEKLEGFSLFGWLAKLFANY